MHNLYAIFTKFLDICKQMSRNLVNEQGNIPRRGVVPKFSDLEVVALNLTFEAIGIDSEALLLSSFRNRNLIFATMRSVYDDTKLRKNTDGFFIQIIGKISALTILQ